MEDSQYAKTHYLDASALIKLVVTEPDSQPIRDFFNTNTNFCATSLCIAEALGRLKGMWKKGKPGLNKLTINEYFDATRTLVIDSWGGRVELDDVGLFNPTTYAEVEVLAKKYNLDLSDALQIVTIQKGRYSVLGPKSASVLITADKALANAASTEGIRVWHCTSEPVPSWA